jgi:hypothetical protein
LTNTEKTRKALLNIREASKSLVDIEEQTRSKIIREILKSQNVPMLSWATPIILQLASSRNLELITVTADKMLENLN